jgi:3-dehydroquinate synthase
MKDRTTLLLRHSVTCTIEMRAGLFTRLPALLVPHIANGPAFVITDSNVARRHGRPLLRGLLERGIEAYLLDFSPGETSKNVTLVEALQTQLLQHGVRRTSTVVALGGGVVGDVAGFVAATLLRGLHYIQVPTTLLAQVDSSIGGKVGVNHPLGKNLIGAFHHPDAVFIDPELLRTLTVAEFRNGLAEVVKVSAALDKKLFTYLERNHRMVNRSNTELLFSIVSQCVALKAAVVRKDEKESGMRKVLNLGHTIGHALESAMGYTLRHGQAVAIGLAAEARIALQMGLLRKQEHDRLLNLLQHFRLPTHFPKLKNKAKFFAALAADKKAEGDATTFVLLKAIGHTAVGVDVPTPFIISLM